MLDPKDVTAVIVTRGDVDLQPILETLPYGEIIVWDNSEKGFDHKVCGRYVAAQQAKNDVIYFQDDDIIFRNHDALLAAYEPGKFVCNMWPQWVQDCGYWDLALGGMGSLCDNGLWKDSFDRYLAVHPEDDTFLYECDFIFGVLCRWKRLDLGCEILDIASADNRMWRQDWQMEMKWEAIRRARRLRKVVLAIMAKNEEANIGRAIRSAKGLFDEFVLLDTGSTDKTEEEALFAAMDSATSRRGHVRFREWVDFATNRTQLLDLAAEHGDYILMMDADEELIGGDTDRPDSWPELAADAYQLHYAGAHDYAQPRLLRAGIPWKFEGKVHAYLSPGDYLARLEDLRSPLILHHGDGRHADRKIRSDIKALAGMWQENHADERTILLLAQQLEALGHYEEAIELYRLRVSMEGWEEEAWWAQLQVGRLLGVSDFPAAAEELLKAHRMRPHRIEPLRILAIYANDVADQAPYPEHDLLYIHRDHYREKENADQPQDS